MADEGAYGSLGGMAGGAGLGFLLGGPSGAAIGAGLGGTAGGVLGGLFSKRRGAPDISGELANISSLFAQLRAQNTANINREAAAGRGLAASNLAARGIYRAPVSQHTFGQLESDRLNSIATSDAQLAGQEAGVRASILGKLLGLRSEADTNASAIDATRAGQLTGLSANLLFAMLNRGRAGANLYDQTRAPSYNAGSSYTG